MMIHPIQSLTIPPLTAPRCYIHPVMIHFIRNCENYNSRNLWQRSNILRFNPKLWSTFHKSSLQIVHFVKSAILIEKPNVMAAAFWAATKAASVKIFTQLFSCLSSLLIILEKDCSPDYFWYVTVPK